VYPDRACQYRGFSGCAQEGICSGFFHCAGSGFDRRGLGYLRVLRYLSFSLFKVYGGVVSSVYRDHHICPRDDRTQGRAVYREKGRGTGLEDQGEEAVGVLEGTHDGVGESAGYRFLDDRTVVPAPGANLHPYGIALRGHIFRGGTAGSDVLFLNDYLHHQQDERDLQSEAYL